MWRRKRMLEELDEEIREHIAMETQDNIERGMSPEEARYAAMRKFGNVTRVKEETREVWTFVWLEQLLQDIRFGLRMLRKSPGFAAVAILTLALGIGANTAIFSVINALLLKTLPVQNPEQLVIFDPIFQGHSSNGLTSYGVYDRLRGLSAFFSGIAGIADVDRSNVTVNGPGGGTNPEQVRVGLVTGNYFETLGVNAVTGRTFGPDDDRVPGGHPVTVISHAYWQRKFSLDPGIVGRTLRLNGTTYTILGVTARDFSGEWVGRPTDLWIPLTMVAQVMVELPPDLNHGAAMNVRIQVLARLRPGVQVGQAQAAAKAIHQQFWRDIDGPNLSAQDLDRIAHTDVELLPAARGYSPRRRDLAQPLAIVAMMVGLVLLIACSNVANLLLVRSATRHREISVRQAVGAGAARIVRQLLTESVLLAATGAALGLVFAGWVTSALMKFAAASPVRGVQQGMTLELHLDWRVLAFTSLLCLLTGILFGLAPALRAAKASISQTLSERIASSLGASARLGRVLVISQVAVSLLLMIVAGLFVQTVSNLKSQDLGFDRARLLLLWIAPGQTGRWGAASASLYQKIEERISSLLGVLAASPSVYGMLQGNLAPGTVLDVPGYVPRSDADTRAQWSIVGRGFFDTLGLQLMAGRNFTEHDTTTAPAVAIINETMARHFFGHENPLGKHFQSWGVTKQIVGVVKDAKYESPREESKRMFYLPYSQQLERLSQTICVAVRTEGPPASFALRIHQTLRDLDPNLPVIRSETIDDQLDELLAPERLMATLAGLFGALAALLACLGLYGLIAYGVSRRRNEIGVRMALGAQRGDVLGAVLKESLSLLIVGIAIGLPMTLGAARMISSRLFGVSAADPVTIVGASGLMLAVGALAGLLPAYRASRLDPMVALRHE